MSLFLLRWVATVTLVASLCPAQATNDETESLSYWGHRTTFGDEVHELGDVDGDGLADVLARVGYDNSERLGYAYALSGADGHVLYAISREHGEANELSTIDDLDADGTRDILVSDGWRRPDGGALGEIRVHSGSDGRVLRRDAASAHRPYVNGARGTGHDFDGDGIEDDLVWTPIPAAVDEDPVYELRGIGMVRSALQLRSGRTGATLREIHGPPRDMSFGRAWALVGDLDGDSVPDFAIGAPGTGRNRRGAVLVVSGGNGEELARVDGPFYRLANEFGAVVVGLGDINGDGVPDWAAGTNDGGLWPNGYLLAYSGRDHLELWRFVREACPDFGSTLTSIPDVDDDGVRDLVLGELGMLMDGYLHVLSGRDGQRIRLQYMQGACLGASSATVRAGPDRVRLAVGGGCWVGRLPETSGYVGVFELDGTSVWEVRGEDLLAWERARER